MSVVANERACALGLGRLRLTESNASIGSRGQAVELLRQLASLPASAIDDALGDGDGGGGVQRTASATVHALLGTSKCVVCLERRPTMAVYPCGHRCLCAVDAPRFVGTACPICRGPATSVLAIYDG